MKVDLTQKLLPLDKLFTIAWQSFKKRFQDILTITLAIYVPINLLLSLIPTNIQEGSKKLDQNSYLMTILYMFIGIIANLAIAYIVKNDLEKKHISIAEGLKQVIGKYLKIFKTQIILLILIIGLLLLLIIPGLIYSVYWFFALYIVLFENMAGTEALSRSKKLVKNRWWTIALYCFLLSILKSIIFSIVSQSLIIFDLNFTFYRFMANILNTIVNSYFIAINTVFYLNAKATKN